MSRRFSLAVETSEQGCTQPINAFLVRSPTSNKSQGDLNAFSPSSTPPQRSQSLPNLDTPLQSVPRRFSICDLNTYDSTTADYVAQGTAHAYSAASKKSKLNSGCAKKNHHRRHSTAVRFHCPQSFGT
ncbi:hypothetical protein ABC855_g1126 [[Candida] zeylanoides]